LFVSAKTIPAMLQCGHAG